MFRMGKEEVEAVEKVIATKELFRVNNALKQAEKFEEDWAKTIGTDYAILLSSGTGALISALVGMGIGPGDEVIVPGYTFMASASAVLAVGAIPVLAEIDETLTIDVEDIKKKISKHTKAIIPVHIQGFPCNMDALCDIAKKHGILILEDACQSVGGSYKGKRLGTIGDTGAYSFNFYKVITAGEGGAFFTDNRLFFERALIYHDSSAVAYFGDQLSNFETPLFCGNEYRGNEISSAVMRAQLKRLDGILADLRKNKKYMMDKLAPFCDFVPSNDIEGDCGTTLALRFDTIEKARTFAEDPAIRGTRPINTGKHIYKNWTPVMEKRGAFHPLMDPFKMEANKDIVPDYKEDMCPKTLDLLEKVVYISVNPDWTEEMMDAKVKDIIAVIEK